MVNMSQAVAILIDGNNLEMSIHTLSGNKSAMLNFDTLIPRLLDNRGLSRLVYFREGKQISQNLKNVFTSFIMAQYALAIKVQTSRFQ